MRYTVFIAAILVSLSSPQVFAIGLDRANFTEIVNDVRVIDRKSKLSSAARLRGEFFAPNIVRTGPDSRAELTSPDETVTRVGSNTLFSFQPDSRDVNLEKGSILFHSPSGKGGGRIRTSVASAAVLGTTLIVSATSSGAMKVLILEGLGKVTGRDGRSVTLNPGQLTMVLPGGRIGPVLDFQLSRQVAGSLLVKGFRQPLGSERQIRQSVIGQERQIKDGRLGGTDQNRQPPPPRNGEAGRQPPPEPRLVLPIHPQRGSGPINVQAVDAPREGPPKRQTPPPPPNGNPPGRYNGP